MKVFVLATLVACWGLIAYIAWVAWKISAYAGVNGF